MAAGTLQQATGVKKTAASIADAACRANAINPEHMDDMLLLASREDIKAKGRSHTPPLTWTSRLMPSCSNMENLAMGGRC